MPALLLLATLFAATPTTRPFHLQLQSNVAATFPLMRRFGAITSDLYSGGFRVKTIWLRGFSRNGTRTFTVENPVTRTYTTMPMTDVRKMVRALGGRPLEAGPPHRIEVTSGAVAKIAARRFRLIYDTNQFIDVWTTTELGPAPEFRAFILEFVSALSPRSAATFRAIPGTPLYVELNMGQYRKLPIVRPTRVVFNRKGEEAALRVSPFMFPAPFGTIFK